MCHSRCAHLIKARCFNKSNCATVFTTEQLMKTCDLKSWKALLKHRDDTKDDHLRDMFKSDPKRFEKLSYKIEDVLFDFSKQRVNEETLDLLRKLAMERNVMQSIKDMFKGERINVTEDRAVLHSSLRSGSDKDVNKVLDQIREFSETVRSGEWKGSTGQRIKSVVNIGIGGSDLGPLMVTEALHYFKTKDIAFHFVSNVDGAHIDRVLSQCDCESTLFLVASKTFTTIETMTNAKTARKWLIESLTKSNGQNAGLKAEDIVPKHFVAMSTNTERVEEFGIDKKNMFVFWDWVGGRYSLWSAIGLSIALSIGFDHFSQLLEGAKVVDEHFQSASLESNVPITMALIGVWNANFLGCSTLAVLPYDQNMSRFPSYLQQLDMESNGKSVTVEGERVSVDTGMIVWGQPGTNGQHAFYQLLHQGSRIVPSDFLIGCRDSGHGMQDHQDLLMANFLAQTEALAFGKEDLKEPHKNFEGNRPSTSVMYERLHPRTLGMLIATYEMKVFVQGKIWNINSFDQFGVELGKVLAKRILPELGIDSKDSEDSLYHDGSTLGLIDRYKQSKRKRMKKT